MGERLITVGEERLLRIPREVVDLLDLAEGQEVEVVVEDGQAMLVPGRPPWRVPIEFELLPGVKAEDIEFFTEEDLIEWSNQGSDFDDTEWTWPQDNMDQWIAAAEARDAREAAEAETPGAKTKAGKGRAKSVPATSGTPTSNRRKASKLASGAR